MGCPSQDRTGVCPSIHRPYSNSVGTSASSPKATSLEPLAGEDATSKRWDSPNLWMSPSFFEGLLTPEAPMLVAAASLGAGQHNKENNILSGKFLPAR